MRACRYDDDDGWGNSVTPFKRNRWWIALTWGEQGWDDGELEWQPHLNTYRTKSSVSFPGNLCWPYNRNGLCKYGDACWFKHEREKYGDGTDVTYYPEHPEEQDELNPQNRDITPGATGPCIRWPRR